MKKAEINLLDHYKKLYFYAFNRFKDDNYQKMREYFSQIVILEIEEYLSVNNKKLLDVGGARGEFCKVFYEKRNCDAVNLDPNPRKYIWPKTYVGFADNMPFSENGFDIVLCRGVLEHIPSEKQQISVNEMYRVIKKGGICYIMIPPWYNPHAGHQFKPFHVLGFKAAKCLRELFFKNKISANSFEEARLYSITFKKMKKMILKSGFIILATRDTHFRLHFLTKIPLLREVMIPSIAFILTKR